MTDFPSYAYGTVSVDADGTVVTGTDTLWSGVNARAGDDITIAGHTVIVVDVTDETHLVIDAWPYDAVTAGTYKITQRSPLRFVGAEARADVTRLLSTLEAKGLVWTLDAAYASPNDLKPIPTANEGQLFYQSSTGKFWAMTSGAWTSIASPYGLQAANALSEIAALGKQADARASIEASTRIRLSPLEYGCVGDGITDDAVGMGNCRDDAISRGYDIDLGNYTYLLGSSVIDFTAVTLHSDTGATFIVSSNQQIGKVSGSLTLHFKYSTYDYKYVANNTNRLPVEREMFMPPAAMDDTSYSAVDLTTDDGIQFISITNQGDTTAIDTPSSKTVDSVSWTVASPDGLFHCVTSKMLGSDELHASPSGDQVFGVVVTTSAGYYSFSSTDGSAGSLYYKPRGGTVQTWSLDWPARADYGSYTATKGRWTVRLISLTEFSVLIEGMEIFRMKVDSGYITNAGFSIYSNSASPSTNGWSFFARSRRTRATAPMQNILVIGDSVSADWPGTWSYWMREALDGQGGIRVWQLTNIAVAGQTSAQQKTVLASTSLTGVTHAVMLIGTNDIQSAVPVSTYISNVSDMIDTLQAASIKVTLVVPLLWWSAALGLSGGQATSNYDAGGPYRAALVKLGATKGVHVADLAHTIGPMIATWKNNVLAYPDCTLRDNIHPSEWLYKLMGYEIGRHVAGGLCPIMSAYQPETLLDAANVRNGWAMTTQRPTFTISKDRRIEFSGLLDAGTKTDGTIVLQLPISLRPKSIHRAYVRSNSGGLVEVQVTTSGAVTVWGVQPSDTYIGLDGLYYEIA